MNVYWKKIDTQKVYLRPPNSSARAAPTKYQLVRKQTPTEKQTKTKEADQKEIPLDRERPHRRQRPRRSGGRTTQHKQRVPGSNPTRTTQIVRSIPWQGVGVTLTIRVGVTRPSERTLAGQESELELQHPATVYPVPEVLEELDPGTPFTVIPYILNVL